MKEALVKIDERFQLALDWLKYTNESLCILGKAGTGKTSFLTHINEHLKKEKVILAPTGIAAINAGGVTIHSFFKLPTKLFLPDEQHIPLEAAEQTVNRYALFQLLRYSKQHIELLKKLQVIIIDEISMVRADVLDMIDIILKHFRNNQQPFGGVQMLLIGDIFQLPPVVKQEELNWLHAQYTSPYFFDSRIFQSIQCPQIEFNKIYRQTDRNFIQVLEDIRNNELNEYTYEALSARIAKHNEEVNLDKTVIRLTTHVNKADEYNKRGLSALKTDSKFYNSDISGNFPESMFPTYTQIELKVGARVMFVKNDPKKQYYNGMLGTVVAMLTSTVVVEKDEGGQLEVELVKWQNIKYKANAEGKIEVEVLGEFGQLPLKYAWAITIHKSQGLTFDNVYIDIEKAFAPGQVYVALSRCRTLEGITLSSSISNRHLFVQPRLVDFYHNRRKTDELENILHDKQLQFEKNIISNAFFYHGYQKLLRALQAMDTTAIKQSGPAGKQYYDKVIDQLDYLVLYSLQLRLQLLKCIDESLHLPFSNQEVKALLNDFYQATKSRQSGLLDALDFVMRHQYRFFTAFYAQLSKLKQHIIIKQQLQDAIVSNETAESVNQLATRLMQKAKQILEKPTHRPDDVSVTVGETLSLIEKGETIASIAQIRDLKESTIRKHAIQLAQCGYVGAHQLVDEASLDKVKVFIESGLAEEQIQEKMQWDLDKVYFVKAIIKAETLHVAQTKDQF